MAMTSASHAEGRQFDPGQVYDFSCLQRQAAKWLATHGTKRPSCTHQQAKVNPATRNRTRDHLIAAALYSQMLYQLSYSRLCGVSIFIKHLMFGTCCCEVFSCVYPVIVLPVVSNFNLHCKMVPRGLEPRTLRLLAVRSNQLSYETTGRSVNPELPCPALPPEGVSFLH